MDKIFGLKLWEDNNTYYTQTNNPSEESLRKEDGKGYLESCGPTTAVNLVHARGNSVDVLCPGTHKPQPETVLFDYFQDPRNYKKFKDVRPTIDPYAMFNNRVPQFYPVAIREMFGVKASYKEGYLSFDRIATSIFSNIGLMVCLKDPGHYIGIVAVNESKKEVIYRDPWPNNYWPENLKGTTGFNRKIEWKDFSTNLKSFYVKIGE